MAGQKRKPLYCCINFVYCQLTFKVKILQGSAFTQTMLGGLAKYRPVSNFMQHVCGKIENHEIWLAVDSYCTIKRLLFGTLCTTGACLSSFHSNN